MPRATLGPKAPEAKRPRKSAYILHELSVKSLARARFIEDTAAYVVAFDAA
jgi:hypothetical protein